MEVEEALKEAAPARPNKLDQIHISTLFFTSQSTNYFVMQESIDHIRNNWPGRQIILSCKNQLTT